MTTLQALLDAMAAYATCHVAPQGLDVEVAEIAIHDFSWPQQPATGALVVGVGAGDDQQTHGLIRELGRAGAAGLVVKDVEVGNRLADEARRSGIALLSVPVTAQWSRVTSVLGSVLSEAELGVPSPDAVGPAGGSLFDMANFVADLIEAPVTLEDVHGRVVAFSKQVGEIDAMRTATILLGQMPAERMEWLRQRGVFRQVLRSGRPTYVEPDGPQRLGRTVIAVRAGQELLGTIWACVKQPLPEAKEQMLVDVTRLVAVQWLRHRLELDVGARQYARLVAGLVRGEGDAQKAAAELRLGEGAFRVLAVSFEVRSNALAEDLHARFHNLLRLHLSSQDRHAGVTTIAGTTVVVVPVTATNRLGADEVRRRLEPLISRVARDLDVRLRVGIGSHARSVADLPDAYATARRTLEAMRLSELSQDVAEFGDIWSTVLVTRLTELITDDPSLVEGPLFGLLRYDATHRTDYVDTLRAYLDSFGDTGLTARRLGVHPNSVRYRLAQVRRLSSIRLDNPHDRVALALQLEVLGRMHRAQTPGSGSAADHWANGGPADLASSPGSSA